MKDKYDVIIVLGRGINLDGTLTQDLMNRVEKAIDLYKKRKANKILFLGLYSYTLKNIPLNTEAEAMRQYATEYSNQNLNTYLELKSKDTLGNAYFAKVDFCVPEGWRKILVVTSDDHLERTKYIFEKVFGPDYEIDYAIANREEIQKLEEKERERKSLTLLKKWIDEISNGDDKAILKLMETNHPGYAKNPKFTTEQLIDEINNQ